MAKTKSNAPAEPSEEESQPRMTFGEHLEELRKRIILSFLGSIFAIVACIYYVKPIVQILVHPYRVALKAHHLPELFTYAKPAEPVITYLGLGFKAGLIISSPWIIYQLWCFIGAGLYKRERKVVYRYIGPSAFLFLLGVAFLYFVVLPLTLNFCIGFTSDTAGPPPTPTVLERWLLQSELSSSGINLEKIPLADKADLTQIPVVSGDPSSPPPEGKAYLYYNASEGALKLRAGNDIVTLLVVQSGSLFTNLPNLDSYLDFVAFAALVFGLAFELPLVIMVLAQIGIVEVQTFRNIRKYAYLVLAILSAIAAPSADVFTMMCLMVPMIGLYEAGILWAAVVVRRQERSAAK